MPSSTLTAAAAPANLPSRDWSYPETDATRDLRVDFMRGLVFLLLFVAHFDFVSAYSYLTWERVGVVSSAETFVLLAGLVTGKVFGKKLRTQGFGLCASALVDRSLQLYRVTVFVILSIGLLRYVPWLDTTIVTTFHDPYTGNTYPLYPEMKTGVLSLITHSLLLRCGPHQFQVMGLYAVLFALTPLIFRMLQAGRLQLLLGLSWTLYLINLGMPESQPGTAEWRPTGAQFEYGFPLLAWQVLFVHGIVLGFYSKAILAFMTSVPGRRLVIACVIASLAFALFSWNHPLDRLASWAQFNWIAPDTFGRWYGDYFAKYKLGPGRLINEAVLFVALFALLTRFWKPIERAMGWFWIPLGQASLYVFFLHVYLLLALHNLVRIEYDALWTNTALHTLVLLLAWWCVRHKVLARWIPG